jgi:hypothetical protein
MPFMIFFVTTGTSSRMFESSRDVSTSSSIEGIGDGGGGPWALVEQGHLPDDVAGSDLGLRLAPKGHLGHAVELGAFHGAGRQGTMRS